jgi:hydrogenase expression/formation protein HypE
MMHDLLENSIFPSLSNPQLANGHDGAILEVNGNQLVFTTDSYVVSPLFFPGGDIGKLAAHGTINDLAMCGARPLGVSVGLIIEEGLEIATLEKISRSLARALEESGVKVVTGDTKVVDHGKGDGLFINTSGVGIKEYDGRIHADQVQPGDAIILSGDLGRHGIAILSAREGLKLQSEILSDCASLWLPVEKMLRAGIKLHCLRDLTRGGLSSALVEIAKGSDLRFEIQECNIPITSSVRGTCEILGLDPLYIANEGRFVAFIPQSESERALELLKSCHHTRDASVIGIVQNTKRSGVFLETTLGTTRKVEMLSGEQLPRIC